MANQATIEIARDVRRTLASSALTEKQAKLYSQRLRRDMGGEGLASFAPSDVGIYLDEAMLLLQCGLLERNADPQGEWRSGIKRAAEILEWLSQSSLRPPGAPLHLPGRSERHQQTEKASACSSGGGRVESPRQTCSAVSNNGPHCTVLRIADSEILGLRWTDFDFKRSSF
jgi:hypothetical protein